MSFVERVIEKTAEDINSNLVEKFYMVVNFKEQENSPKVSIYKIWEEEDGWDALVALEDGIENFELKIAQIYRKEVAEEIYLVKKLKDGRQWDWLCDINELHELRELVLERLKKEGKAQAEKAAKDVCQTCGGAPHSF